MYIIDTYNAIRENYESLYRIVKKKYIYDDIILEKVNGC